MTAVLCSPNVNSTNTWTESHNLIHVVSQYQDLHDDTRGVKSVKSLADFLLNFLMRTFY